MVTVIEEMRKVFEVRDLAMDFGGLRALDGLDLHVDEGEIVALIGPNGAGKTTFFNCVTGIYRPAAGEITVSAPGAKAAPKVQDASGSADVEREEEIVSWVVEQAESYPADTMKVDELLGGLSAELGVALPEGELFGDVLTGEIGLALADLESAMMGGDPSMLIGLAVADAEAAATVMEALVADSVDGQ